MNQQTESAASGNIAVREFQLRCQLTGDVKNVANMRRELATELNRKLCQNGSSYRWKSQGMSRKSYI